ncbi:hypothetical protein L6452_34622 [Arctium lappa]|uniref:Uncharacterized protein n=1 Tax=Arctium lappa TaxID=4217 RepID=A0ACB8YJX7_ARCLA|nr:hypothetical protein L6452_34622 [Arctium lappa]
MANNHNYKNDGVNTKSISSSSSSSSYSGYKSKPSVTSGLRRNNTGSGGNSAGGHQKDTPEERKSNLGKENRLILLIDTKEWRWGFIRVVPSRSENSPIQKVSSSPGHSVCHMCVNSSEFRIGTRKKTVSSRFSYRSFRSLVRYGLPEEDDVLILIGFFDGFLLGVVPPVSSETAKP